MLRRNGHRFSGDWPLSGFEGLSMRLASDWPTRLQAAAEALERSRGAPDWLKSALRAALGVATDLASAAETESAPPEFFYSH